MYGLGYDIVNAIRFHRDPSDTLTISNRELVSEADIVFIGVFGC